MKKFTMAALLTSVFLMGCDDDRSIKREGDGIDAMLRYNQNFVARKKYERFSRVGGMPSDRVGVITCMDTRLVKLLPYSLGIQNDNVKMIKVAGPTARDALFDNTIRSAIIGIYALGLEEIMVIGHCGCGVQGLTSDLAVSLMRDRGITQAQIDRVQNAGGLDRLFRGFTMNEDNALELATMLRNHPLMPEGITVRSFVIDPNTGLVSEVTEAGQRICE